MFSLAQLIDFPGKRGYAYASCAIAVIIMVTLVIITILGFTLLYLNYENFA